MKHPGVGSTGLPTVPGLGGEVRLKVWTVLGMESGGPFRKRSCPAGPRREPGRGASILLAGNKEVTVGSVQIAREALGT